LSALYLKRLNGLTVDLDKEHSLVVSRHVLCPDRHTVDTSALVTVPDGLTSQREVHVHGLEAIPKVHLVLGGQDVALQGKTMRPTQKWPLRLRASTGSLTLILFLLSAKEHCEDSRGQAGVCPLARRALVTPLGKEPLPW
jgi:hypothetical protein